MQGIATNPGAFYQHLDFASPLDAAKLLAQVRHL
jgi:hypothetical protein